MMLIAAIAVIVFSVVGIATMMGWLPSALSKNDPAAGVETAGTGTTPDANRPRAVASTAATCGACGVTEQGMVAAG